MMLLRMVEFTENTFQRHQCAWYESFPLPPNFCQTQGHLFNSEVSLLWPRRAFVFSIAWHVLAPRSASDSCYFYRTLASNDRDDLFLLRELHCSWIIVYFPLFLIIELSVRKNRLFELPIFNQIINRVLLFFYDLGLYFTFLIFSIRPNK